MSVTIKTTASILIRNSIFNIATNLLYVTVGFFLIPFFILKLGVETYGVWILIGSIYRYKDILTLGLNSAVNRYIPVFSAKGDNDGIAKVINTSLVYYLFISLFLIIITIIIYHSLTIWFNIPIHLQKASKLLVLISGFGFSIIIPLNLFVAILSGYQRYDLINLGIILQIIIRTTILIILLMNGYSIIMMGLVFACTEIILKLFYIINVRKLINDNIVILKLMPDYKLLWKMISYGFNTFLFIISSVIIYRISDMIIGIYLTTKDVASYSVITALILVSSQLLQTFLSAIKPAVSDLSARQDKNRIKEIALLSQKYSIILLLPLSTFYILMGKEFLNIWLGSEFIQLSTILTILTISTFFFLAQYSNFLTLVGKGEHKIFGVLSIIMAISTVILAILSQSILKLGLIGIALSTFFPVVLISGILLQLYFNKKMKILLIENITHSWWPAIKGCIPSIFLLIFCKYYFPPENWFQIGIIILLSILFTLMGAWFLSITNIEKNRFLNLFNFHS